MVDLLKCADDAISNFVREQIGTPPWPNWAGLKPGDTTNGWGASAASWRAQAKSIISDFDACAGVRIQRNNSHLNKLRTKTLTTFRDYMVEQAGVVAAEAAVMSARAALVVARTTARMAVDR
jgi:hypothetical protein